MKRQLVPMLALGVLLLTPLAASAQNPCNPCAKNPCNPCAKNPCNPCGKASASAIPMPSMNPCYAKGGTAFYVNDPMMRDSITFESEAPLEDIVGTTNALGGYVVLNPEDPEDGIWGEFMVPVSSLNTGIPLRDEHLQGEMWLDAASHPHIALRIEDTSPNLKKLRGSGEFESYEGEVDGFIYIKGEASAVKIPARIVYMPESEKTQTRLPGNLLGVRADLEVPLADFGITGPADQDIVGTKVGDVIAVSVSLTGTTAQPQGGMNPCNPCAKNPCNPCAKNPCNPCAKEGSK